MKPISILALVLCACFGSVAWAQRTAMPRFGKQGLHHPAIHHTLNAQVIVNNNMKVWNLGTYPGGYWSWVNDINDFGVVVGWSMISGPSQQHPATIPLFGPNALQWVDLGTLGGEAPPGISAEAFGMSDTGIVVGHAYNSTGNDHAFVWTSRTGIVDRGTLPGHTDSEAQDVNRIGTLIVGYSAGPDGVLPVVWTPTLQWTQGRPHVTWKIHQLPVLDQFPNGLPYAVNNFGQIVGGAWGDSGDTTVLWSPTSKGWKPKQLYGNADYPIPWPAEINDRGEVVGMIYAPDWIHGCAALWQPTGPKKTYKLTQLPNPWGVCNGDGGIGINNQGDIVGVVYDENFGFRAAYWRTKDTTSVELMPLMDLDWSYSTNVNEFGIAAAVEGGGDVMHGMAVQLH
jgi:probable HAF family extracellular repeat protein